MSEGTATTFDAVVCDLDGVVYAGPHAVAGAVEALRAVRVPVLYATNNASRTPDEVAEHLRTLGVSAAPDAVVTSSTTAAHLLSAELPPGTPVMAVGGPGVGAALRAVGLDVRAPGEGPVRAVVQGYGRDVTAGDLAEAALAIQGGARWVATNTDTTLPTAGGLAPGNGSLVAAVRMAVDVDPEVIGKPQPPMYLEAAERLALPPGRVLAVGDRLDTDIAGARAAGMPAVLVLTGVDSMRDAAAAPPAARPDFVTDDLVETVGESSALIPSTRDGEWFRRGPGRARLIDGRLDLDGEEHAARRAVLDALWEAVDDGLLSPAEAAARVS